jgi:hypothetical protein
LSANLVRGAERTFLGEITMHQILRIFVAVAAVGTAQGGFAQMYPNPAGSGPAVQIAQARQANAALMHQYTWQSRTEIIVNGQIKDIRIQQESYGPYGALQTVLLNDQPSDGTYLPTPIGFLRRAVADNEKQQMEQYLTSLKGMLSQYTLPGTGSIYQFMSTAVPTGPDANGNFTLTGYNVVQPGDNLTLIVNGYTRHPRQLQVNTTFQGDSVQLSATFATVPVSGLNYAAFAEATVPAKGLSVQVQNYNFARLGY